MADPGYLRKLRAITRADPTFAHVEALEQELYASPSDRSAVGRVCLRRRGRRNCSPYRCAIAAAAPANAGAPRSST